MNKGFETEAIARERAFTDMPDKRVQIIESQGQFYVEPVDDNSGFIRSWERVVFTGMGKRALKRVKA